MKFALDTSSSWYKEDKALDLMKLELHLEPPDVGGDEYHKPCFKPDDWTDNKGTVEINSLEELMTFVEKWGRVIVSEDSIEIYDNYRE